MLEDKIRIISAGAGSGKTYRLTRELAELVGDGPGQAAPEKIIATTFTKKAAAELVERLRQFMLTVGRTDEAERLSTSFIGTVNGVSGQLLQYLAFEAGISPSQDVIAEEDQQALFNRSVADVIDDARANALDEIAHRFGILDWKESLKGLVDAARSNDLTATAFAEFAEKSTKQLLAYFPSSTSDGAVLDAALKKAVKKSLAGIRGNDDQTKGTATYLELLESMEPRLERPELLEWSDWVKLAVKVPTKKSLDLAQPVATAAGKHRSHPRLRADITTFIVTLFELAAAALQNFQEYKRARGLIDFVDQESNLLQLLVKPSVQERLGEELDILLVDEFQDTSPIQLALFLKVAEVVRQAVWVGDPKQSIYGFRGADPTLMAAVTSVIAQQPGDILQTSYRSRPDLVNFVNGLFTPAFAGLLTREQVVLTPDRKDHKGQQTALRLWPLAGTNIELRMAELADGIVALINEGPLIEDKDTKSTRKAVPGDIAVLCRMRNQCQAIATALNARGVKVAIKRPALLQTPEGKLAVACLRYFINRYDTLANAEIQVLTSDKPAPEQWLASRLRWLAEEKVSHEWGDDHPVLAALRNLGTRAVDFSPAEALDEIIEAIDLRRIIVGWGERQRRLGNLENLRLLVRTYVDSCLLQAAAATVAGFLLWLSERADAGEDMQAEGFGADAVNILTCHASKGLEWPIVVVAALDAKPRENIWGLSVVDDRKTVLMATPLEGRWLRYWPWPYGKTSTQTGVAEALAGTKLQIQASHHADAEELRLLYVTLTRARDYLVLSLNPKTNSWLDNALAHSTVQFPLTSPDGDYKVVFDKKITIPVRLFRPTPVTRPTLPPAVISWVPTRTGRKNYPPVRLSPSKLPPSSGGTTATGTQVMTGAAVGVTGKPAYDLFGTAIHDFLAVDCLQRGSAAERQKLLEGLFSRYGVAGAVNTDDLLENIDGFYVFLEKLKPLRVLTEWPISLAESSQALSGTADLLVETAVGWVIIDHKTFPGPRTKWAHEAEIYRGQLSAYGKMVAAATGMEVAAAYVHFVCGGGVVQVL